MPFVTAAAIPAAVGAAGAVGGALISSSAAKSAASTQAGAAEQAAALQNQQYQQTQQNLTPYMGAGTNALNQLQLALGIGGSGTVNPSSFISSPGYAFQQQQGQQAINAQAAATGGVNSGNTLKALQSFGQQTGNQSFQQYLANLMGLTGAGQNAAAGLGGFGANSALAQGQFGVGAGNAQAAGTVGSANALSGGLGSLTSPTTLSSLQNLFNGGGTGNGVNTNTPWDTSTFS